MSSKDDEKYLLSDKPLMEIGSLTRSNPDVSITKEVEICQFVSRLAHGGWHRCVQMADGVSHMVDGSSYKFCPEHATWSTHAWMWQNFRDRAWESDPHFDGTTRG